MENHTLGMIVVTIISLLFLFGVGSIVLSFFFDPKDSRLNPPKFDDRYYTKVTPSPYSYDGDIPASVVFDSKDTFDLGVEDIE